MHPVFEKYFEILLGLFERDIEIMSQGWMYYTILPIIGYFVFFFFKWAVVTAPIWFPFSLVIGTLRTTSRRRKKK